jgi:hypothetical protein
MTYELWSGTSGNLLGAFSTEGEAFEAVRRAAARNGAEYVASLALVAEDDAGESELIAEGADLVRRIGAGSAVAH